MARVFLSYDREDASRAKGVALALEKDGHSVWWDRHIKAGSQYSREIEQALNDADAVVVLWSPRAIDSPWVRDEAAAGRDRNRLVPVLIEACEPPLGFRQFQNIDLSRWKGRGKPDELAQLLDAIPRNAEGASRRAGQEPVERRRFRFPSMSLPILALVALVIILGAFLAFRASERGTSSEIPIVAVVAGGDSATAKDWARDVLIALGGLEGAAARSFRLVDEPGKDSDLVMEVSGTVQGQNHQASLVLRSAKDRSLLWSRQFQRPGVGSSDLHHEVVHSAALVLRCAKDGYSAGRPLEPEVLNIYLGGCWEALGPDGGNLAKMTSTFLKVIQEEREFERAWAGLLYAESELARRSIEGYRQALPGHIVQARRINPQLAEAYLAEAVLLPPNDVIGRIRLADEAVDQDPDNALVLMQRSFEWNAVGRMTAAVEDAYDALQLLPLSPWVRDMHVYALQGAGQFDRARKETAGFARVWPRSGQLWFMRMRSTLEDPAEALTLLQAHPGWRDELVSEAQAAALQARIEPTERNVEIAITKWRAVARKSPEGIVYYAGALAALGRTEEIFATMDQLNGRPELSPLVRDMIFRREFHDFWRDPRSMRVAKQLGVLDYWRKSGNWPDFCFEADHPYDCKAVAAKV